MRLPRFPALRPYICAECRRSFIPSQTTRRQSTKPVNAKDGSSDALNNAAAVRRRIEELGGYENVGRYFPRLRERAGESFVSAAEVSSRSFLERNSGLNERELTVYGRVLRLRLHGKGLGFLDLATNFAGAARRAVLQVQLNAKILQDNMGEQAPIDVKKWSRTIQKGDWYSVKGVLRQNNENQWTLSAYDLPQALAPSLQPVPETMTDPEIRRRNAHAAAIVDPSTLDPIYVRHRLIREMRKFFEQRNFVEVSTPLIVAGAGGAIARPFETVATEFSDRKLNLRVAPELFLKRLIVAGVDRVFEIGPAFRNEGVDATHNPEFTMCEFYATMFTLKDLMAMTESLFQALHASALPEFLPETNINFQASFKVVDFIPAVEDIIRRHDPSWVFPDLTDETSAVQQLRDLLIALQKPLPQRTTLPRLVEALAEHFIEPGCHAPTFIINYPECTSPLAKSFLSLPGQNGIRHRVVARAELFINGREYVNCYEEENSPIEQRRKFEEQLRFREGNGDIDEAHGTVDESYINALEWGMPPTGGWGCGIDRIVMLFAGKDRIADVLPFGTLRNVVGLGSHSN